ncbi:MAG: hypothetical protein ISP55_03075 [Flavobacteriales bacterium]|nr:hypothetical protein [Flavobacteriales bacterium]
MKMTNVRQGLTVLLMTCALGATGQGLADVMQYSRQDPLGSARTMGMGGAMTALGADLGSIWSNPAGLGMYRSSDLSFSLGIGAGGARTDYLGTRNVAAEPHAIVGQLGVALTMPMLSTDFKRSTFAVAYTPLKDFHQRAIWSGEAEGESITSQFAQQANGTSFDSLWYYHPFDAELAWYTYLIDTVGGSANQYAPAFTNDEVTQELRRDRSGRMGETTIGFGTSYRDQLHIGLSVGIVSTEMNRVDVYRESKISGPSSLQELSLNDRLEISGSGAYWSFGLILQPKATPIRLGWSYRSGTVLSIEDFYQVDATAQFAGSGSFEAGSPSSFVEYRIRTPRRHQLGFSWTLGKVAVISVDYGQTNYAQAEFMSEDFSAQDVNRIQDGITDDFTLEQQYRAGLELRVQDELRFRIGGGWRSAAAAPLTNPFGDADGSLIEDSGTMGHASLGGEYRVDNWYAGATYRHTSTADGRRLYGLGPEVATGRTGLGLLMLTIGARY